MARVSLARLEFLPAAVAQPAAAKANRGFLQAPDGAITPYGDAYMKRGRLHQGIQPLCDLG